MGANKCAELEQAVSSVCSAGDGGLRVDSGDLIGQIQQVIDQSAARPPHAHMSL